MAFRWLDGLLCGIARRRHILFTFLHAMVRMTGHLTLCLLADISLRHQGPKDETRVSVVFFVLFGSNIFIHYYYFFNATLS